MKVPLTSPHRYAVDGTNAVFCSARCRDRFAGEPVEYLSAGRLGTPPARAPSKRPYATNRHQPFHMPWMLGFCLFAAIALFFLWSEHKAHILGALPYLLVLLCPLLHGLMHRGHGGRAESSSVGNRGLHQHGEGGVT